MNVVSSVALFFLIFVLLNALISGVRWCRVRNKRPGEGDIAYFPVPSRNEEEMYVTLVLGITKTQVYFMYLENRMHGFCSCLNKEVYFYAYKRCSPAELEELKKRYPCV
jgi:hypothetical protein